MVWNGFCGRANDMPPWCQQQRARMGVGCWGNCPFCPLRAKHSFPQLTGGGSELYNTFHPVLGGVLITGRHTSKFQRNEFVHIPFILVGYVGTRVISVPRSRILPVTTFYSETSNETCSGRASVSLGLKKIPIADRRNSCGYIQ